MGKNVALSKRKKRFQHQCVHTNGMRKEIRKKYARKNRDVWLPNFAFDCYHYKLIASFAMANSRFRPLNKAKNYNLNLFLRRKCKSMQLLIHMKNNLIPSV